jgi:hypothetical protein
MRSSLPVCPATAQPTRARPRYGFTSSDGHGDVSVNVYGDSLAVSHLPSSNWLGKLSRDGQVTVTQCLRFTGT